jgi:hypothetical protein
MKIIHIMRIVKEDICTKKKVKEDEGTWLLIIINYSPLD